MRRFYKLHLRMLCGLLLGLSGCDPPPPEEKLVRLAQESVQQQASQNETIARQSESGAAERELLADATRELIAKDAEARREMVETQRQLTSGFHAERERIDLQKVKLEQERRELAQERNREPIIAATLQGIGILLAAVLPLAICLFVLYQLYGSDSSQDAAVTELLLTEITAEHPLLLSSPVAKQSPLLTGQRQNNNESGPEEFDHFT